MQVEISQYMDRHT